VNKRGRQENRVCQMNEFGDKMRPYRKGLINRNAVVPLIFKTEGKGNEDDQEPASKEKNRFVSKINSYIGSANANRFYRRAKFVYN
jgi:hypothetical protein